MAVVETLDIVLGAKTQQMDSALHNSIKETRSVKNEIDSMSASMQSFEPITVSITAGIGDLLQSIPGVSAGIQVFQATAIAINSIFAARQASAAARVAQAIDSLKNKTTDAVQEIRVMAKELERSAKAADDIVDVDFTVMSSGAKRIGSGRGMIPRPEVTRNPMVPYQVGQVRSAAEQRAYIKAIDESLIKTATYRSNWTAAATASRTASVVGTAGAAAIATGVGVAVAGVAAFGLAWHKVNQQMKEIDAHAKAAATLGMTFRELSTVRFALAESSGLDDASIDVSMRKMTLGLSKANKEKSGELHDLLSATGLDAAELLRMGPAKALEEIAAKTQALKNPTDQLVLAYELFGKQGTALVQSLRGGPEAIRESAEWAEKVGMNLSESQAMYVQSANDAWGRVTSLATGFWRQISAEVSPVLQVIYKEISASGEKFTEIYGYLPDIVDNTVYFSGVLYDVYQWATLTQTTLHNIVTLNWSDVGKDISAAFTFDSGDRFLSKVQKAREEARLAAEANSLNLSDKDSAIEEYEARKQAAKAAADQEKEFAREQQRIEEQKRKAFEQSQKAIQKRFDAVRQEIEIQQILASMSAQQAAEREQEIRDRIALHAELREHGMFNFQQIDALTNAANEMQKQNELRQQLQSKADDLTKQFNPGNELRETMAELDELLRRGMIDAATYIRGAHEAGKKDMPEVRGAVSVQANSVEAYKLLLDRENQNRSDQLALRRAAESSVSIQREMLTSIQAIQVVGRAR